QQGDRRLAPAGQAQTDDRGVYRVWGLNPGDYYISATAQGENLGAGRGRGAPNGGRGGFAGRGRGGLDPDEDQGKLMYAPTYYPGVGSVADARSVTVGVSQEVLGIDFGLQLVRTARVSGHVENPDGSRPTNGNVSLIPQNRSGAGRGNFGMSYGSRIE